MAASLEGIRLLIVDDDDDLREILQESFEAMDAVVDSAHSGQKALEIFQLDPHKFDVVISDMRMPGGGGLFLARGIKVAALEQNLVDSFGRQRPLFVIYSGFNDLTPEICQDANISYVFSKPMCLDDLAHEILTMLRSQAAV